MVQTSAPFRLISAVAAALLIAACNGEAGPARTPVASAAAAFERADPGALAGVQDRIGAAIAAPADDRAAALEAQIAAIEAVEPGDAEALVYYRDYWLAYALYQLSIERQRAGRVEDPQPPLERAISLLEDINPRDSEAFALHAMAAGLNLQFVPRQEIMIAIGEVNGSLGQALALDPDNVRGLYANAISDWNTPTEFGGRQRAEAYLRRAVEAAQEDARPLAPTWGHDLAHALLVEILLETGRADEAQARFEAARARFPDSSELAALAGRF
jgi:tetratricopeptide (TPR) repeat protein